MQKFNYQAAAFMVAIGVLMSAVTATAGEVGTVGDLSRIQAQTVLLNAKLKRDEIQEKLDAKRTGSEVNPTLPVVKSIFGNDKSSVVTFIYEGNVKVGASQGDLIPGGYTVAKIDQDSNKVELRKGKEVHIVGTSSTVPVTKQKPAAPSNQMSMMPPMGMMPPGAQ